MKFIVLATALLLPTMAIAQDAAAPAAPAPATAPVAKPKRVAAPVHAAPKPAAAVTNEVLDVNQSTLR